MRESKALCMKKHTSPYMKTYYFTVDPDGNYLYFIVNDSDVVRILKDRQFKEYFKTIEQVREEKIKELGI